MHRSDPGDLVRLYDGLPRDPAVLRIVVDRNDAPLTVRREPGDRFVGTCRDFALLHVSLLRHAGVPARLRSGFADYFGPAGFHGDHVVTEYRDEGRGWLLADAQLADQETFGLHPPAEGPFFGERFVAGNIRLDLAALNKVETLLWDVWGEGEPRTPLPPHARELYDRVAPVVSGEVSVDAVRKLFAEEDGLRTPATVTCHAPFNGPSLVTLRP
ncbi:transglutaminase-like domain-containing protein [Streptomyces sp. NPDC091972]|uniref:transglutaminase-like domain-containing protein n=1 Tax=Streptomyces sp. NPDC091972 TaxID=3366007 RepID=UPI003815C393